MCHSARRKASVELADIFSHYADSYIKQYGVSSIQHKAINAITRCRTAALGGHVSRCNYCSRLAIAYNSCRYRYCPKCQTAKQLRWLQNRKSELLPTPYFHVVFTLPHELNPIASYNPEIIYNLLFKAAWNTINTLGHDKKRLNGQMGMTAFLHTWGQNISQHIHLHCMIPAGALSHKKGQPKWHPAKKNYLFPSQVMSKLFGKLFSAYLEEAFKTKTLKLQGGIATLSSPLQFAKFQAKLREKTWNVYAKEPFNGAEGGMEYLARYAAKTALSNERLLSYDNHQVAFEWRDYSDHNKTKIMTLEAHEFIRRYLSHVLPQGFMRIRYFGFLGSAKKNKNLTLIRSLLPLEQQNATFKTAHDIVNRQSRVIVKCGVQH
jgi:hypothetical protein